VRIGAAALVLGSIIALVALRSAAGATTSSHEVLDIGDSLSVGTAPYLALRLRGSRIVGVRNVGLHAYDAAAIVAGRGSSLPPVIVVSAGTNDDPRIVSTFWQAVSRVVTATGPRRCVVWPTIVRPPAVGTSYDGLNRALAAVAKRHPSLRLVDWVGIVGRHPGWLAADGVHVSSTGYRARAAAIALVIRTQCPHVFG
jgi:lysophospholipase L1-like esterase